MKNQPFPHPILVYGDSDNITIKNCVIDAHGGQYGIRPAVFLAASSSSSLPDTPAGLADGFRLQNCRVITRAASIPALVQSSILSYFGHPETGYNTVVPDMSELKILENEFDANGTVVSSLYGRNINISGNIINCVVPPDQYSRPFTPNLLEFNGQYSLALAGDLKIQRNIINLGGAANSDADFSVIAVMNTTPSSTCTIANNMITGLTTGFPNNVKYIARRAIYLDSSFESTGVVVHNSIHMPPSFNPTVGLSGIATTQWDGTLTVKNNILSMDAPGCHALSRLNDTGSWISDHNNIFVTSGTYVRCGNRETQ